MFHVNKVVVVLVKMKMKNLLTDKEEDSEITKEKKSFKRCIHPNYLLMKMLLQVKLLILMILMTEIAEADLASLGCMLLFLLLFLFF